MIHVSQTLYRRSIVLWPYFQVYLSEICDVLAIAMAELPNLLSPAEVAEALLMVKHGPDIICHVVANQPEIFSEVATHLLRNGERYTEN